MEVIPNLPLSGSLNLLGLFKSTPDFYFGDVSRYNKTKFSNNKNNYEYI